ncbi:PDC sensor domain-containing protein [Bacillus cereus]
MIQQNVLGIKDAVAKQGGIVITEPYKAKGNGHIVVTIAKQAEDKNSVVAVDLSLDNLLKTTKLINIGKKGICFHFRWETKNNCTPSRKIRRKSSRFLGEEKFMKIIMVLFLIRMTVAKNKWYLLQM